jgi:hypothetical protein
MSNIVLGGDAWFQSKIGKEVKAAVQLGIWSSPVDLTAVYSSISSKLIRTIEKGDTIGKINGVTTYGEDYWFSLEGGGYIHASSGNLVFKSNLGWWLLAATIAVGGVVVYKRKQNKKKTKSE